MKAIYPMVGASAAACAQNLKSSSFTGTFSSGWTFASTGVTPNGTSAYMDTTFLPSTSFTNNNTHIKQKFNLNVFLNEQCKDAINIGDFINSLKITLDDLNVTREKTLEDSVGNIFLRGLKELDIYKRPIHCTDNKRDIMYIKDEEKWEKDEGNSKLKDTIGAITKKQITTLKQWKDSDPEVAKTSSSKNDDFLMTFNHICTPIPEVGEKRIIKTIGKEVHITD
jgi:hypothetical protein